MHKITVELYHKVCQICPVIRVSEPGLKALLFVIMMQVEQCLVKLIFKMTSVPYAALVGVWLC